MLRAASPTSTQGQQSQQQTGSVNDSNKKLNGSSLSLLKATSKGNNSIAMVEGRHELSSHSHHHPPALALNSFVYVNVGRLEQHCQLQTTTITK